MNRMKCFAAFFWDEVLPVMQRSLENRQEVTTRVEQEWEEPRGSCLSSEPAYFNMGR